MTPRFPMTWIGVAALLAVGHPAVADDGALYAKPIDPKAAFVRVIAPGSSIASVKSSSFNQLTGGVSPYVAVTPGEVSVSSSFGQANVSAKAGKFYSAVLTATGETTVEDDMTKNPAKATLTLYNLTERAQLDLFVPQAGADAVSDVTRGASKSVALRAPLDLDLVVRDGETELARIGKVEFKRLAGIAVVVTETGDTINAIAVPSTIAR
ncbi:alginate O-acetyltransferase AlgF [Rhizobium sp. PL01]|uniref:alginate O-acetyltransferase AlgF n=1 Tax=Rhizobium sp. PL01 TaxID=3085631 RepID=UPI0029811B07|nr:alginate O-acetyltransferase AlgF [Rhizobium sp. PL01]MDW5315905.1 alginate O-acetyltransferase AlgF [Rhizobium sp. PL01]